MAVLIDRTRQRANADDVIVDLHHLGDSPYRTLANDQPGTLADESGVTRLIEECPGQAGLVFAVEIDHKVEAWYR
jgi:hypothetical protein